ncbi:MFS transporter [Thalassobaculum salexigens]|uniref:MFS transporter n=1 Tax=Thalassobaculum salexigens TaxID=455360 RepID=UPI00248D9440|nr:MFS transporter [Thalassobaculum salexigens]
MSVVTRLQIAGCGMHLADQIALVGVPLTAALAFDASPEIIGILVACQSLAHLLGSIPAGLIVDRGAPHRVARAAVLISLFGFGGTAASVVSGTLIGFGACVTAAGFGIVLFVLTVLSMVPRSVPPTGLAQANARIEMPRAAASFAVPLVLGAVISVATVDWVFPAAIAGGVVALAAVAGLPRYEAGPPSAGSPLRKVVEGGAFVRSNDLLMAIAGCALFWNFAFSALLVTMVPLITDVFRMEAGVFGIAMAAFGLAAFAGSSLAARYAGRIRPSLILLFGPGSSVPAVLLLLTVSPGGSPLLIYAGFFLLGFGPSMWMIAQNSVRQLVSPRAVLGRVNAVIQTTIYGARPLGALCGGFLISATSPETAVAFVALAYGLSFAAAAFSRLRSIRSYGDLATAEAG